MVDPSFSEPSLRTPVPWETSRRDLGGRIEGVHAELRTAAAAGRSFDDRQVVGQVSDAGDNPQGGGKAPLEEKEAARVCRQHAAPRLYTPLRGGSPVSEFIKWGLGSWRGGSSPQSSGGDGPGGVGSSTAAPDRSETLLEAPQARKRKRGRRGHRRKAVFLGCGHWYRPPRPRDVVPPPLQGDARVGEDAQVLYVAAVKRGARKPTPPVDEIAGLQRKILKLEREAAARETELETARRVAAERHRVLTEERDLARSERGVPFEELYRVQKDAKVEAQEDAAEEKEDLKRELRVAKIDEDELKELRWRSVSAALGSSDAAARHCARPMAVWKRLTSRLERAAAELSEAMASEYSLNRALDKARREVKEVCMQRDQAVSRGAGMQLQRTSRPEKAAASEFELKFWSGYQAAGSRP